MKTTELMNICTLEESPSQITLVSEPSRLTKHFKRMIRLTEISSLFRVEELYVLIDDGFVQVNPQVPSNSFTYQIVEKFLKD